MFDAETCVPLGQLRLHACRHPAARVPRRRALAAAPCRRDRRAGDGGGGGRHPAHPDLADGAAAARRRPRGPPTPAPTSGSWPAGTRLRRTAWRSRCCRGSSSSARSCSACGGPAAAPWLQRIGARDAPAQPASARRRLLTGGRVPAARAQHARLRAVGRRGRLALAARVSSLTPRRRASRPLGRDVRRRAQSSTPTSTGSLTRRDPELLAYAVAHLAGQREQVGGGRRAAVGERQRVLGGEPTPDRSP